MMQKTTLMFQKNFKAMTNDIAQVGDTIIMKIDILQVLLEKASEKGAKVAIEAYSVLKNKDEKLTPSQIAKIENCSTPTVLNWINNGVKKGNKQLFLKSEKIGLRDHRVTRHAYEEFKKLRSAS